MTPSSTSTTWRGSAGREREGREPVRQRELLILQRTVRKHVAESLLTHVMPALVSELLEAAADDLSRTAPDEALSEALSDLEAQAPAELRVIESVERCKAVLDAVGLEALARIYDTHARDWLDGVHNTPAIAETLPDPPSPESPHRHRLHPSRGRPVRRPI